MRACRLRDSNTLSPRYEGGALPIELSRQKRNKWSAAALRDRSHLATGTTAPSRVQRRWPILDVHDVKQQSVSQLRFTHVQNACVNILKACNHCRTRDRSFARTAARASCARPGCCVGGQSSVPQGSVPQGSVSVAERSAKTG